MRLLLTRPRPDSEELARTLAARGVESVVSPALEIVPLPPGPPPEGALRAILLTSGNAAPALAAGGFRRTAPVLCVGGATARRAAGAGFADVRSADGDARGLALLARRSLDPRAGRLLWLRGAETSGGLADALRAAGFEVEERVVYRADPAESLSPEAAARIAAGGIDAALLFSPRSARIFAALLERAGLARAAGGMAAWCVSRATARAAAGPPWREVRVAARPDLPAMLALLPD